MRVHGLRYSKASASYSVRCQPQHIVAGERFHWSREERRFQHKRFSRAWFILAASARARRSAQRTERNGVGLSKDPVLRYQVGTKKMKTSRYQVSLSPGGTEYPGQPGSCCAIWKLQMRSLHNSTETCDIKRRKCIKLIKHFKDRHPDQMKEFKQVSFYLIFRYSVMNIIPYFNLNVGLK